MTQPYPGYLPPPPTPPTPPPTPQYPVQPSYPVAPGQLPAPSYGQYAQQGFAPGYPQQNQPPLAQGSLDDFFSQPSAGGGKSLSFKAVGTRFIGIVTRPLGPGDVQQQTDTTGRPQTFRDGRPKFVMKVPLQMQPSPDYPDGLGVWFVKGQARDELVRAMAEAGAPAGPPEANSIVDVTYVGDRQSGAGMNPAKQFAVAYTRPDGAAPVQQPEPQAPPTAPQPPTQPAQQYPAPQQQPAPQAPAQPQAPAPSAPQPPADMSPEQQALLAKLRGAQPQPTG